MAKRSLLFRTLAQHRQHTHAILLTANRRLTEKGPKASHYFGGVKEPHFFSQWRAFCLSYRASAIFPILLHSRNSDTCPTLATFRATLFNALRAAAHPSSILPYSTTIHNGSSTALTDRQETRLSPVGRLCSKSGRSLRLCLLRSIRLSTTDQPRTHTLFAKLFDRLERYACQWTAGVDGDVEQYAGE